MRIIAGHWRGRKMVAPKGMETRPTADRVRETLFSMLVSRLGTFEGLRVADLFAGSGALGLEALSRGAEFACFVESDPRALGAIRLNVDALAADDRVRIVGGSAFSLPRSDKFDLIFADPPYTDGSGTAALRAVAKGGWLDSGGWLAIETAAGDSVDPGDWEVDSERKVGRARITLIRVP